MLPVRYEPTEALSTWSPVDRLARLRDEMDRLFDLNFPWLGTSATTGLFGGWTPALDVYQDKDNVYVRCELPGMKREEIDISLHDGMLSISGERKREEEFKEGESFRSERYFGRFHRAVTLPTGVNATKVHAAYKDGILTITCPKSEEAKPKHIEVSVS